VCNQEGALNATVAYAMAVLSDPTDQDSVINLGSGSGSLLIERGAWGRAGLLLGVDDDSAMIACAGQNIAASTAKAGIQLLQGDVRRLPCASSSADVILADLPFGQLVGSHKDNMTLYPDVLREAARVAKPGARAVFITHEIRLMDNLLRHSEAWRTRQVIRITLRGLHPRIYVLSRL
jgi:23S rRNA G2445 N2-methylase RlmL